MSYPQIPDEFVNALLAQDDLLQSPEFADHRRRLLEQVARTEQSEKQARKALLLASSGAAVLLGVVLGVALYSSNPPTWPEWVTMVLALTAVLSPITALLLLGLYLYRYRLELHRARREARQQALLEIPRQMADLRRELDQLRQKVKSESASPQAQKPGSGFTLTELVVVIAVITILASLLFPALSGVKSRVRSLDCKNNLAQIGKALAMYESDFRCFPGGGDSAVQTNKFPWVLPSPDSWDFKIVPYVGSHQAIFVCAEYDAPPVLYRGTAKSSSFGYNAGGSAQIYSQMDANLGLGFGKKNFVASTAVTVASDMVSVGDVQFIPSVWCNVVTANKAPVGRLIPIPARHAGGANMLFVDSHIEWQVQAAWIADNDKAKSRWNNDHQPHPETW